MNDLSEMKTLSTNDKAKQLLAIRYKRDQLRELVNNLDVQYDQLRNDLLEETSRLNVLTLKTEEYTIMRKKSLYPVVLNQSEAIEDIKKRGIEPVVKLDMVVMKQLLIKESKENPVKGTEVRESEYISIKQNKKLEK
jgi:hypothetical protein